MKLSELIKAQSCGALNIGEGSNEHGIVVGGAGITLEQCRQMAGILGWLDYDKKPWEVIDKTAKFIRGIKNHITSEQVLGGTEVTFQNRRKQNTESYFDRIKMVNHKFDITILYGAHGAGGTYAVFSGTNGFNQPVFNCRTSKQLGEYINTLA